MRVLVLTRYGPLGSASRLRFYQYLPHLRLAGHHFDIAAFFTDDYVRRLYAGKRQPAGAILRAYWSRFAALAAARRYDLLWVEKEFLPWLPAVAPALLRTPYVVDYDDAHFHRYDRHRSPLVRLLLGRKVDAVMRRAAAVVAGNEYLAQRAQSAGARRVAVIPTVVDPRRYPQAAENGRSETSGRSEGSEHAEPSDRSHRNGRSAGKSHSAGKGRTTGTSHSEITGDRVEFRIGWIGAPVTVDYLLAIEPALQQLLAAGASLTLIGAASPFQGRLPVDARPWTEDTEAAELARLDAGIMPLPDEPFERGKCGYKLIQYMACGLPVVASPVGANTRIVEPGVNGFLADTQESWIEALESLRRDPALRRRLGAAGRAKVRAEYSLDVTAPQLLEVLEMAGSGSAASLTA